MKAVDDVNNVEKYNNSLLLRETFFTDDVMLQVHEVSHLVRELIRYDAVKN